MAKKLQLAPAPGAGNPNPKLYGNVQPGLKVDYTRNPTFDSGQMQRDELNAYNAQQNKVIPNQAPPQTTIAPVQSNKFGGLSQGFITSNPKQALADLMAKGYSSQQAQQLVNQAKGIKPGLTLNSGDYTGAPIIPPSPVPSLADTLAQVQNMFQPLGDDKRKEIQDAVASEFAPRFAEQKRINDLRDTMFKAATAQRGDTGFGRSDLSYQGEDNTSQFGADNLSRLQQLQSQETQARIDAAQSKTKKDQMDFLALANDLRSQQLQEFQQTLSNQRADRAEQRADSQASFQRAQSQLNLITDLDPGQIAQLGDLSSLEYSLGLPPGYVNALNATKEGAAQAQSQEDFTKFFNDATKLALTTPTGQDFTLRDPTSGDEYTFSGQENDIQIVSSDGGIWAVDKNTQKVSQLKAPDPRKSSNNSSTSADFDADSFDIRGELQMWSDKLLNYEADKSEVPSYLQPFIAANGYTKEPTKAQYKEIINRKNALTSSSGGGDALSLAQDDVAQGVTEDQIRKFYPELSEAQIQGMFGGSQGGGGSQLRDNPGITLPSTINMARGGALLTGNVTSPIAEGVNFFGKLFNKFK